MSFIFCVIFAPFFLLITMMIVCFAYCFYEFILEKLGIENPIPIVFEYIGGRAIEIKKVIDKIISKW